MMDLKEGLAQRLATMERDWWEKLGEYDKDLYRSNAEEILTYLSEQGVGVLEHDGKRILIKEKSYTGTTLRTTFIPLQEVK